MNARVFGSVVLLQVQSSSLKIGSRSHQTYTTSPLRRAEAIEVDARGVSAIVGTSRIMDVHHLDHPESKHRGRNGVSIGFTEHYDRMRDRFGCALTEGSAGENIVVAASTHITLGDLAGGIAITSPDGEPRCELSEVESITPCRTFSRYLLEQDDPPADVLKAAMQFLNDGMRGFYCSNGAGTAIVRVGDLLLGRTRD